MTPVVYDPVSPYCCRISPFRYSLVLVSNWVHCWRGVCRGSLWVLSSTSYLVTQLRHVLVRQQTFAFSDYHSQTLHLTLAFLITSSIASKDLPPDLRRTARTEDCFERDGVFQFHQSFCVSTSDSGTDKTTSPGISDRIIHHLQGQDAHLDT